MYPLSIALELPLLAGIGLALMWGLILLLRRIKGYQQIYNLSPGSHQAKKFTDLLVSFKGRKILVLGDMLELGEHAVAAHEEVGRYAKERGIEQLLAVGTMTQHTVQAFGEAAKFFTSKAALIAELRPQLTTDTLVLIKGSRGMAMEEVVAGLQ